MSQNRGLAAYYAERAAEYEQVYHKPERQAAIGWLNGRLARSLSGHKVLEVACGTGFWTQAIAETALSVVATDVNSQVLDIARRKPFPPGRVDLVQEDAYAPRSITDKEFTAGFSGFWWSHIPKSQIAPFLETFHSKLRPGALVVFADNRYVEGSNHPIAHVDAEGNTYQERVLGSGTRHRVLKNFPTQEELEDAAAACGSGITYEASEYFWCLSYTLR